MIIYYNIKTKEATGYSLFTELPIGGASVLPAGQAYVVEQDNAQFIQYINYTVVDDTDLADKIVSYPANVEDIILAEALAEHKKDQSPIIAQWVADKFDVGVEHTFNGSAQDIVQTRNPNDLVAIQGLVSRAMYEENFGNAGFLTDFRAESNTIYSLTIEEVYGVSNAVNSVIEANRIASWSAKDAVEAATTIAEVDTAMSTLTSL